MDTIGERIKELRAEKGLTQKELAAELSITIPTLSHWECNYQEPSSKDIINLCKFFGISTDYLLGYAPIDYGQRISTLENKLISWFRALPSDAARREFVEQLPMHTSTEKRKKA